MSDADEAAAVGPILPSWLPPLKVFGGDWTAYEKELWAIYEADFVSRRTLWRGKEVWTDEVPLVSGRPIGFWHIASGIDAVTKELLEPNFRRCERLAWVKPILEADPAEVRTWVLSEKDRVKIALPDFSFVVILKERPNRAFLKTAYPAERPTKRAQWQREYEEAKKR